MKFFIYFLILHVLSSSIKSVSKTGTLYSSLNNETPIYPNIHKRGFLSWFTGSEKLSNDDLLELTTMKQYFANLYSGFAKAPSPEWGVDEFGNILSIEDVDKLYLEIAKKSRFVGIREMQKDVNEIHKWVRHLSKDHAQISYTSLSILPKYKGYLIRRTMFPSRSERLIMDLSKVKTGNIVTAGYLTRPDFDNPLKRGLYMSATSDPNSFNAPNRPWSFKIHVDDVPDTRPFNPYEQEVIIPGVTEFRVLGVFEKTKEVYLMQVPFGTMSKQKYCR